MKSIADNTILQYYMKSFDLLYSACLIINGRPAENTMRASILILLSHSIELIFKANLLDQNFSESQIEKYGHKISKLYKDPASKKLLQKISLEAEKIFQPTDDASIMPNILDFLDDIDRLHSGNQKKYFPLRYQTPKDEVGPAPYILISIFSKIAKEGINSTIEKIERSSDIPKDYLEFKKHLKTSHYNHVLSFT